MRQILLFIAVISTFYAYPQRASDSTIQSDQITEKAGIPDSTQLISIGIDIAQPITGNIAGDRQSYEIQVAKSMNKGNYAIAEIGYGSLNFDQPNLAYASSNFFTRIGLDKSLLSRQGPEDFDIAFVGVRYAFAYINRSEARYTIVDPVWGDSKGSIPKNNFAMHWFELTGGVKVELFSGFFTGYIIRGKFLLYNKGDKGLPAYYVAGYGKGEKKSLFDFNVYLSYGLRYRTK